MPVNDAPPSPVKRANFWPGPDRRAALADFWLVYDREFTAMNDEMMPWLQAHPLFGPMMKLTDPAELARQQRESRQRLRSGIGGDWTEYERHLRQQGAMYAQMGMAFRDWYELARIFERYVVPHLVREYIASADRLSASICAMQDFLDAAMVVLAESYLEAKEATIRESEHRLATTLDSIGDAVIATDAAGKIVRLNPVASELTGWDAASAVGRPLADVFVIRNEFSGQLVETPVERVLREGVVIGLANHTELVSRSGKVCPIADSAAPIRGDDGSIGGVVLVFRDQTAEREAEAEALRNAGLEGENRRMHEANRLKSEFLANMSHELRTPLNAILGFGELLHAGDAGPVTARQVGFLGHILTSGQHLLKLINDVLDLSKVESGKMDFEPESVDLRRLATEVAAGFAPDSSRRGIEVRVDVADDVATVVADSRRLRQVLLNYFSNAMKFTGDGGRVALRAQREGRDAFRVEVEDTGLGIAAADIPRLFVEFQQLDSGTTKQHQGTGLGLALTRRLVEAQGGTVGVESTLGKGSRFYAVLPLGPRAQPKGTDFTAQNQSAGEGAEPTTKVTSAAGAGHDSGKSMILVVEDDIASQVLMVNALSQLGHASVCYPDAESGLDAAKRTPPTAVILDLMLPGADGFAFLQHFRNVPELQAVPVVVWTVRDLSQSDRERLQAREVIPKGQAAGQSLLEALERYLPPATSGTGAFHGG